MLTRYKNREHAGNAGMLEALGITHVVSVGETLISCPLDCDPMYGKIGQNALANAYHQGKVKVYVYKPTSESEGERECRLTWRDLQDGYSSHQG